MPLTLSEFPLSLELLGNFLPVGLGLTHADRVGVLLRIFPLFELTLLRLPCANLASVSVLLFPVALRAVLLPRHRMLALGAFSFPTHHLK